MGKGDTEEKGDELLGNAKAKNLFQCYRKFQQKIYDVNDAFRRNIQLNLICGQ